jgi:methylated-DNA-[protein]-cysteine S-methyltransferase
MTFVTKPQAKKTRPLEFYTHTIPSPIGPLTILIARDGGLVSIQFGSITTFAANWQVSVNKYACGPVALQLAEYFAGARREFQLELANEGTPFQREVWYRLQKVVFGETITYSELARKVGRRDAVRAVANAVAVNPIPIIIPCHRVIPKTGGLGFYARRFLPEAEGSSAKKFLLNFEKPV